MHFGRQPQKVLDRYRQTMERSVPFPGCQIAVSQIGFGQNFSCITQGDDNIPMRIEARDILKERRHHIAASKDAFPDLFHKNCRSKMCYVLGAL